ncbi:hypothetical protein PQX77_016368, partial [Marasmius sp. AFHP31]
ARIWWISREARRHLGRSVGAKYKTIVATILESGLLYPTTLIIGMVIPLILDPESHGTGILVDFSIVSTLMSGLAPTLIIVRIAYRKSVDSVDQSSIRLAETCPQQDPGMNSERANGGIQSQVLQDKGSEKADLVLEVDEDISASRRMT